MNYLISPSPSSSGGGGSNSTASIQTSITGASNDSISVNHHNHNHHNSHHHQLSSSCGNMLMMKRESVSFNLPSASHISNGFDAALGSLSQTNGANSGLLSPTQNSIRKCFSLIDDFMECHSDYDSTGDSNSRLMFINGSVYNNNISLTN